MTMRPQVPSSLGEGDRELVGSGDQTAIGADDTIRDRTRRSRENRNQLILALISLALLFGVVYFAELDDNYWTSTRITAAIQRVQRVLGTHTPAAPATARAASAPGAILVAENDDRQRLVAKTALERSGYAVLLADNGSQAAALLRTSGPRISLVLVDRAALGSSAAETVRKLKAIRPNVPILVSRARGEKAPADSSAAGSIETPFSALPLATAVQKALASR